MNRFLWFAAGVLITPTISAFFSDDDAPRLGAIHQARRERLSAAEAAGDRRTAADARASLMIFEVIFCDD